MESQPQNPEFRNNPENFHPCVSVRSEGLEKLHVLACLSFPKLSICNKYS